MDTSSQVGRSRLTLTVVVTLALLASLLAGITAPALAEAGEDPAVTSIEPSLGSVSGGTELTITGTGLDAVSAVAFDGEAAAAFNNTAGTITVTTPPSPNRAVKLAEVTLLDGSGAEVTTGAFMYKPDITVLNRNHVVLGELASRSQRQPVERTPTAPYLVFGTDSLTGDPYTYETDSDYVSRTGSHPAYNRESDERTLTNTGTWTITQLATFAGSGTISAKPDSGVLQMQSTTNCLSGNTFGGMTTYCSVFGPDVYTEPFFATAQQALAFEWAARGTSDDYEIYAFLVAVPDGDSETPIPTDTASHTLIAHGQGDEQNWRTATGEIPTDGYYRFRFVNGSYDATGGYLVGSNMFIDDIVLVGLKNAISFPSLNDIVQPAFPADPITVPVTADSGALVTVESLTPGICAVDATTSTVAITPLAHGQCTLRARQGLSGEYAPAATITRSFTIRATAIAPSAPTIISVTPGADSLSIAFQPGADGGAAISNYEYTLDGGTTWAAFAPEITTSPAVISGLAPETAYTVRLRAVNPVGASSPSGSRSATTLERPPVDPGPAPAPSPAPSPAPAPGGTEPVRDGGGELPRPGNANARIGDQPAELTITPTPTGGRQAQGDGFSLAVNPTDTAAGSGSANSPFGGTIDLLVRRGTPAELVVDGFAPNSTVTAWLFSEPYLLGEFETDAAGDLTTLTAAIPPDVLACAHTLHAEGTLPSGQQVSVSMGIWVEANPYPFGDVSDANAHRLAIACIQDHGIVRGTTSSTYTPSGTLVRGQAASIVAQTAGLATGGTSPLSDVAGTTHEGSIAALMAAGWATGYDDGTFRPWAPVTRGQLASLLAQMLDLRASSPSGFADAGDSHGAAIAALVEAGVITGFSDGTVRPNEPITRAQAASMIVRALRVMEDAA